MIVKGISTDCTLILHLALVTITISSFPIFREFLLDCCFLEYYLHNVDYMPAG